MRSLFQDAGEQSVQSLRVVVRMEEILKEGVIGNLQSPIVQAESQKGLLF
ncbi:MAG: hypothetical protein HFH85_05495 [Lachnospiraceae bacterium]|jgi:hypothetical protein|nr:hypothetical protein [Lachnospiraceae bacterium]